jgi:hypothetical protein
MRITIIINTDNAAFQPDPWPEVARILRELSDDAAEGPRYLDQPRDYNGNTCGSVTIKRDQP